MLRTLSGREHVVHSGLCLRGGATEIVRLASTRVRFRQHREADWTGTWARRSGGSGPAAMPSRAAAPRSWKRIDGDHSNVVGLPVTALVEALARAREAAG